MVSVTHPFVSAIATDPAATAAGKITPTNWNAGHTVTMAGAGVVGGIAAGAAAELTLSQVLDLIGSAAQGDILYRSGAVWKRLPVGTINQAVLSQGAAADLAYGSVALLSSFTWADFVPGFTGFSVSPVVTARYLQVNKLVFVRIVTSVSGVSNDTTFGITGLPAASSAGALPQRFSNGYGQDNSISTGITYDIPQSSTGVSLYKGASVNASSWTNSGNKFADLSFFYEAA